MTTFPEQRIATRRLGRSPRRHDNGALRQTRGDRGTRHRLAAAFTAAIMAVAMIGAGTAVETAADRAPAAEAASVGLYIVTPKWAGWCSFRWSSVVNVGAYNLTSGDSRADWGDDVIWVRAVSGRSNTIRVTVGCSGGRGSFGTEIRVTPTRDNQTVFVWPTGGTWLP